jgi:hypothetical protein
MRKMPKRGQTYQDTRGFESRYGYYIPNFLTFACFGRPYQSAYLQGDVAVVIMHLFADFIVPAKTSDNKATEITKQVRGFTTITSPCK